MDQEISKLSIETIKYFIKTIDKKIETIKTEPLDENIVLSCMNDGKIIAYVHCKQMLEDILRIEDRSQFNEKLKVKDGMD